MAVYNEKAPPQDQLRLLRSESGVGNIPGTAVFSMVQDLDGEVWVGTDEGIGIFYTPSTILTDNDYDCVRPLVNFDGYVQYLLETEVVTAIAVDGDNHRISGHVGGNAGNTLGSGGFYITGLVGSASAKPCHYGSQQDDQ